MFEEDHCSIQFIERKFQRLLKVFFYSKHLPNCILWQINLLKRVIYAKDCHEFSEILSSVRVQENAGKCGPE